MKYLTAAEILSASDLAFEDVNVEDWGGTVKVRELSAKDRQWFVNNAFVDAPKLNGETPPRKLSDSAQAMLLSKSIVDESGNLIFSEKDIPKLAEKSQRAVQKVEAVAIRLSRLGADAIEETEKNFVAAPSGDSSSV